MPTVVSIDGRVVRREEATVSVYDRGFLYGDSVFETLRTFGGRPDRLDDHLARLARSAALVGIALPVPLPVLSAEVHEALAASAEGEAVVRITLSRGVGPLGLDPRGAHEPRRVVFVEPLPAGLPKLWAEGLAALLVRTRRAADALPEAKTGAYLDSIVALRAAQAASADEAIIVDPDGWVLEGTASNVFAVLGDPLLPRLVTPPEGRLLPGLTRAAVLSAAGTLALTCEERPLHADELFAAREVIVTSSVRELVAVVRLDGRVVGEGRPGPQRRRLHEAYRASRPGGAPPPPPA